jgi:hypothetical protein
MNASKLTRREALAGLGLLATAGAALSPSQAQAAVPGVPGAGGVAHSDLDRFVRLRGSPDGAPVMWVYAGVLLGKPEGQVARPLVRVHGVSFTQARRRPEGGYDWRLDEVGYYSDLASDAVLEAWVNPFTGAAVRPAHYHSPEYLVYSDQGIASGDPLPPGAELRGAITRLADVAGIAAMTEDLYVTVAARPAADGKAARAARAMASLGTYTAVAADLDRAGAHWVDCQMSYGTMNSFAGWLGMEGTPGVQNMRLAGRKCRVADRDAVPRWLRDRMNRDYPQFLDASDRWPS